MQVHQGGKGAGEERAADDRIARPAAPRHEMVSMNDTDSTARSASPFRRVLLRGDLEVPVPAVGLVVFAHGSGSSRRSPGIASSREAARGRHRHGAHGPADAGGGGPRRGPRAPALRRDVSRRTAARGDRMGPARQPGRRPSLGYFGASTGAAAALLAASALERGSAPSSRRRPTRPRGCRAASRPGSDAPDRRRRGRRRPRESHGVRSAPLREGVEDRAGAVAPLLGAGASEEVARMRPGFGAPGQVRMGAVRRPIGSTRRSGE